MNEKIIRPGVVKRVVDLLKCRNKKYTQEDVETIIFAFWDIVIGALSNGDSVNLNGYATIGTKYMAEKIKKCGRESRDCCAGTLSCVL